MSSTGSQLVTSAGPTLKSINAKPIAIANEKMICPRLISVTTFPSSSSSRAATFAEIARARKPIASDSPSAMTPRMTGRRQMRCRFIGEVTSLTTSSMPPSGVRIATAQHDGPRIITPSRTAWPPYETLISAPYLPRETRFRKSGVASLGPSPAATADP